MYRDSYPAPVFYVPNKLLYELVWDQFSGATWNSNLNRSQISQGAEIMGQVVPIVIHLMMNDYQRVWGEACYPVVE
ncbi:hypothetical protein ACFL3I_02225 [Pseudomonadota bacterium]